jgi:hypothetical protein
VDFCGGDSGARAWFEYFLLCEASVPSGSLLATPASEKKCPPSCAVHPMSELRFTDRNGSTWILRDYKIVAEEKQPVAINDSCANCRSFESVDTGTVFVYTFGQVSYRTTEPNVLEGQLLFAKPVRHSRPRSPEKDTEQQLQANA